MASGIFTILDDIAALMDDVAVASKIATQKTAGILGDDLAVNAEKATGFVSSRELPVLWAITKGSLLNKVIIVPIALFLNIFFPVAIKVILVLGGAYLAYEGVEKIVEYVFHRKEKKTTEVTETSAPLTAELEKKKVQSAIATDFILSIEIVIIALGTVLNSSLTVQVLTVSIVALLATIGVYGIVALIVRMDDAGFNLIKHSKNKGPLASLGHLLVKALPLIIRILAVVGTVALILVSGDIFAHKIDFLHHYLVSWPETLRQITFGLLAGTILVAAMAVVKKIILWFKRK